MIDRALRRTQRDPLRGASRSCIRALRAGFTMPEILVVAVVVGVLSLMVVPHMELVRYRMDGATRGTVAAMVAAQRVAVKRQHDVVVRVDTAARRITIHEDGDNDGAVDAGERVRQIPLGEEVEFGMGSAPPRTPYYAPVTFSDPGNGIPTFRFTRSGSASEEGAFYLTSTRAAESSDHPGDTRLVQIDRATGRASWHTFSPPEWEQGF